ncbi:YihY/virulence factor BrkB family protein [Flavobacterium algicola]|uniref:YihY/virulence factor BrkB family protein n=1 Tax=Flavobacterium algicola TaxID=556529 RepID=UPI001EFE5F24|nr:YihY/virulence factor BrkB family protein [Flavobacterium algicola]MCG9790963.1 YihY/virulence factor BrkB family protein [Flavobacterium algicola]
MKLSKEYFKALWEVIKQTIASFLEHKVMKMSASLAYVTMFSLGPLLLVILYLSDIFLGREAIEGKIFGQIKSFVGPSSAVQIQNIIENLSLSKSSTMAGVIGVVTLLIGATSVFAEIQDSINTIWGFRPKKQSGIWLFLKSRLLSFGVIGSFGFILLVSLGVSAIMDGLSTHFFSLFSDTLYYLVYVLNSLITFGIISLLFGAIFTILPDAQIKWRQVRLASFVTAILFMIGKFLISIYISNSNIQDVYGTAGSFVVVMTWVYYSSVILYFGAEFAMNYAVQFSTPIMPSKHADIVHAMQVVSKERNLQDAKKEKENMAQNP